MEDIRHIGFTYWLYVRSHYAQRAAIEANVTIKYINNDFFVIIVINATCTCAQTDIIS